MALSGRPAELCPLEPALADELANPGPLAVKVPPEDYTRCEASWSTTTAVGRWPDPTAVDQILGREDELAQIRRFLEGLRRGPSSLVLEGEPGIGKTTLWAAGIDTARELGYEVVFARAAETETQLSFAGLADICGTSCRRGPADTSRPAETRPRGGAAPRGA